MKKLALCGALALALAMTSVANAQTDHTWVAGGATWIDISGTGTPLSLSDDGEVNIATGVSNGKFAAGDARVGSNGAVRFGGTGLSLAFTNAAIPSAGLFSGDQSLAVFWDDINTSSGTNGQIYWEDVGDKLVVQWQDAGFFGSQDHATFQLQVHGSGPSLASFLYRDIESARANGGGSATIGYQEGAGDDDAQFSFNTAGSVSNGTIISLVPEPTSLILLGLGGLALIRRR